MSKFKVEVSRDYIKFADFIIEADTEEEAQNQAEKLFELDEDMIEAEASGYLDVMSKEIS